MPMTGTEIDRTIGMNVRLECVKTHSSYASVADAIGLDQRAFRRRTRGEVSWSATEVAATARVLKVPVGQLFEPIEGGSL